MIYTVSIAIYLLALVGVGIYKTKMVKSSEDFMVAGRILPWYILVGTLLATWMGSGSLFSGAGLGCHLYQSLLGIQTYINDQFQAFLPYLPLWI